MEFANQSLLHYAIKAKLDKDSSGETFLAVDRRSSRSVFLKLLSRGLSASQRAQLLQECRALQVLNHPNITRLYDVSEIEDQVVLAAEYLGWRDLDELLRQGHFGNVEIAKIGEQVVSALGGLHAAGILLRTLTPSNILVDEALRVKLFDSNVFGHADPEWEVVSTKQLVSPETINYVAPEVLAGGQYTNRSDLYALGVVLFQMGTGRLPYQGDTFLELADAVRGDPIPSARTFNTELAPDLNDAIGSLLEKDPTRRNESVQMLLEAFGKIARPETKSGSSPPTEPPSRSAWQATTEYAKRTSGRVLSAVESAMGGLVMAYKGEPKKPAKRFVNAWFEGDGEIPPLRVATWYTFRVNIGAERHARTGTSGIFSEPDFGENKELKLVVSLFSEDFEIKKDGRLRELILPREGDTGILSTEVRPLHEGTCLMEIVISLSKELEVLQVLEAVIQAEPEGVRVPAGA